MEYKTLGEICDISSGGTPLRSKKEFWKDGTIPWLKISDIKSKYVNSSEEYITSEGLNESSAKLFSKGTILYTIFATLGEVGILDFEACTNQAIAGLKIKDHNLINTDYLYYYLKSKKTFVNKTGRGVAQNNINMTILKSFVVPIPDLKIQKEIVKSIDNISQSIDNQKRKIKLLDELVKARFVEMFGDPIENTKHLDTKPFAELCESIGDGLHGTPEYDDNGEYYFINGNNLEDKRIVIKEDTKKVSENEYKKHFIELNDKTVLLSINGTLGKTAFYNDEKVILGKSACYCKLKDDLDKEFVITLFDSDFWKKYMNDNSTGTTIKNFGLKAMREFRMIVPSKDEQKTFIEFIQQIDKSKFIIQKQRDETQKLFDKLMQDYFG